MSISHYIKEIGRGKNGARALSREQACDLFAQVLDKQVTDLEIGAFCLAMRIKGETLQEMLGFLDATRARTPLIGPTTDTRATVVLPSYNGARRFPVLTPLLAALLVRAGCRVVVHGFEDDANRITTANVLAAMGQPPLRGLAQVTDAAINFISIDLLCPPLADLLRVRNTIGLRNSAHSLVKLLNPCAQPAIVVGSYTHAEYLESMDAVYRASRANAMLLRGLEGECVADARRLQRMDAYIDGQHSLLQEAQTEAIGALPDWPAEIGAKSTADYIHAVLDGRKPVPAPIAQQVAAILEIADQMAAGAAEEQ